jgi:hypothetical protein
MREILIRGGDLVPQTLNMSDEQVEYQVRDRLWFSRFLGLAIEYFSMRRTRS